MLRHAWRTIYAGCQTACRGYANLLGPDKRKALAREEHAINDERARIKTKISELTDSAIKECKKFASYEIV